MSHEYFFEIVAEEIPAWMFPARLETIRKGLEEIYRELAGREPEADEIRVDATSRRIFFRLTGFASKQSDREEEIKGPPLKIAYDEAGSPSKALAGFLKKNSATAADIRSGDGDYVLLLRKVPGRTAGEILSERIPALVESIRWPKMMRWGKGEHSYIRPIHSVISLLDGIALPVSIFGLTSGTKTPGHRISAPEAIEVSSYQDYVSKLEKAFVVVAAEDRVGRIRDSAAALGSAVGAIPASDSTIWDQWRYLTEFPALVRAEFDPKFLSLPREVLETVMRVHQKQLPLLKEGQLTNSFLAIVDQVDDSAGNAATGNAFVTNARFEDARFFYEADRKRTLAARAPDLTHLQFHEKLGNYADKSERITMIAGLLAVAGGTEANVTALAGRICKSDLMTEMVKEFPDLQGRIGGIYAREEGLSEEVWQAVYDHYSPTSIEDALPRNLTGRLISISDKIDTLAGFFILGLKPTGSKDPYALRRAAQGIVQILLDREMQIGLGVGVVITTALDVYRQRGVSIPSGVAENLEEFFAERVRTLLESQEGLAYDEIAAAMTPEWKGSLVDLQDRAAAISAIRGQSSFLSLLDSARRIANITSGVADEDLDEKLLTHETEKRLAALTGEITGQIDALIAERKYLSALETFAGIAPELEKFFNDVMVMVDDEKLRSSRIALLRKAGRAASRIGDVTRIVVARRDYDAVTK